MVMTCVKRGRFARRLLRQERTRRENSAGTVGDMRGNRGWYLNGQYMATYRHTNYLEKPLLAVWAGV